MLEKSAVQGLILKALQDVNLERTPEERFEVSLQSGLFGPDAVLDSLSLVSVIVDVETALADLTGRDISLTDDRAMSQPESPFTDVRSLTDYIMMLLEELS